jgi:hypothetical protein
MAHRSCSGPPETFSPPFSPLCPWIHGLFPAIEFIVAPSPSLPNSGDPRATLARARLNFGDLTAAERNDAARSRLFPGLIPSVRFRSNGLDRGIPLRARAPDALTHLSVPPAAAHPSRSDFPRPILIERLGPPRTPPSDLDRTARTPSDPCSCPFPLWCWEHSVSALSPSVADTPCPACQRSPAPARALGRRSNLSRWF